MNEQLKRSPTNEPLKKAGLRFFDKMTIIPAFGKKKELRLNRTRFDFSTSPDESQITSTNINLKQIGAEKFDFQLELVNEYLTKDSEDAGRFLLRVKSEKPIWLNGNYVFEAFLKRGDEIHFSYNKIVFHNDDECRLSQSPFDNKIIESNISLLIEGETGTGKTFLAKNIHEKSNRLGAFVHVNLSSFSLSLIESELFGHVKGAFTGAVSEKMGALREANMGTLFLDEIDSLPYEIQTKLLLFLDSGIIRPVGGSAEYKSDIRLICASGQKLEHLVKEKKMRKDFYYRISSGFKCSLKPLRSDKAKIVELCESFAKNNNVVIDSTLMNFYKNCMWPGNVRELFGHLEKKKAYASGRVLYYDDVDSSLEAAILDVNFENNDHRTLKEVQSQYCKKIFYETKESIRMTADVLGVTPATVRSILKKS